jgi:23S rRNA (guanosine2251-2'-O)-methyltransferase
VVFGVHAVRHLLHQCGGTESPVVTGLYVQDSRDDERVHAVVALAEEVRVPVHRVARSELDRMARGRHQGVVARLASRAQLDETDLTAFLASLGRPPLLLVLDGVQDPHNLGACLRSANAAGVDAVLVPRHRAVGLTPTVRKVACGAAEATPLVTVTNLARSLRALHEAGVVLIGTDDEAGELLYDVDFTPACALVMGGEAKGLRRLTREACDQLVRLPMAGSVESLNVSVAAGVCLFEAVRQRRSG